VNDAPVAVDDSYTTAEDEVLMIAAPGVLGGDSDVEGDASTALLVGGPSHGTLMLNGDGSFTYTPDANYHGPDSFSYKVNDGSLDSNTATVSITVTPVDDAPVAVGDSYTTAEDEALTIAAPGVLGNDSDVDGDALTALLVGGPSHGTLTLNGVGSFTYTPDANYHGPDGFSYEANDGSLDSNLATVTITVTPSGDAPVAVDDSYSVGEDGTLTIAPPGVLGNDSDVEGDALSAALVTGPSHGTLALNADGSFTYAPQANYFGPDSFTYRVGDGSQSSNVATVSITVDSVNDAPVAENGTALTEMKTPVAIELAAEDEEGNALSYQIVTAPSNGTLSGTAPDLTYTPKAKFVGTDSFTFRVNDGTSSSNLATVVITVVKEINEAPEAFDDTVWTNEDMRATIRLKASDPDGNSLKYHIVSEPEHGTLTGSGRNLKYRPDPNYNGPDSFTFKVSDKNLVSNVATVQINVAAVNDAPVMKHMEVWTKKGKPVSATLEATDVDGDTLTFQLVDGPRRGNLVLDSATGAFTYTPNPSKKARDDRFIVVANDGQALSRRARIRIDVREWGWDWEWDWDWDEDGDWRKWWDDSKDSGHSKHSKDDDD
jgi:VCBS repeat-containing protein